MRDYVITSERIITTKGVIAGAIAVEKGKIAAIGDIEKEYKHLPVHHCQSTDLIMPGFIDIHIHGSNGCDVMDAKVDALDVIAQALKKQGVLGFLATTMTQSEDAIFNALQAVAQYQTVTNSTKDAAKILGVHLEGPFISPDKIGAQNPDYLQRFSLEKLERWQYAAKGQIRKLTLAPEIEGAESLTSWCKNNQVIASIGHTNCTAKQAKNAIDQGCLQATHLFNAMSGIDHRHPGAAMALLMAKDVAVELIVDGVHLADDTVRMVYEIKGADHIILITDAISAQGVGEGVFELGGQKVLVKGNQARLENGVLAGSVLTMNKALATMLKFSACSLPELVKMTSTNAAKSLGLAHKMGDIQVGMDAGFVVLDHTFQIKQKLQN
ncbi:N-acetylglucosamine-6-phosphate deacetylase [Facilibium subflavum]|uniref:N-acetylglucosamine-6-phosphate deacetylase n=1 Tax=Facilibium subflavum TaxID=2219058 RepID=UPI000E64AF3E|nr:N-acetylglucosamine-6-phosphate deacetylase [Facilibium subflavum]